MNSPNSDIEAILAKRFDNGADYWATSDGRIYVGNPFSTLSSLGMLHELGVTSEHEAVAGGLRLILDSCRDDGRIRLGPKTPMYPCYTAEAARILCRFGLSEHDALSRTIVYLLGAVHDTGGWRCNFTKFGKGPETECSNPGATLYALDVLRHFQAFRSGHAKVNAAVESLLHHWVTRLPTGPCHWGIGTLFMQVEYPFLRYNLFFFVYILSFYERAKDDFRFREALASLTSKLNENMQVVVERRHRALKEISFCATGRPSVAATARFAEIRENLN